MPSPRAKARDRNWHYEFQRAFDEGRFAEAAHLYDRSGTRNEPPAIVIQAARAHIHSDPATALRLLIDLDLPASRKRERVERDALLAETFARTKDFRSADDRLTAALNLAVKLQNDDFIATVGYRTVRRYLHEEKPALARASLDMIRKGRSASARIHALYAETFILPYEERVHEQAERLIELLRGLDPNDGIHFRAI